MSYIEQFQPRRDNLCSYFEFESTYTESRHMPWVVHRRFPQMLESQGGPDRPGKGR